MTNALAGEKIDLWHGSYHWIYERGLSVTTLALISAAFVAPNKIIDFALGVVIPLHCHIGIACVITDYLPKRKFPVIYPLAKISLLAATAGTMYGLYKYNTTDVGISEGVGRVWNANKKNEADQ